MAIVDYQTILADKQVITETTLSDRSVDLQALADYGMGHRWAVHVLCQGAHANDLRVQVLGSDKPTFESVTVIGDSGVFSAAELTFGKEFYVDIVPTGKKYRYVALRFIPTIHSESQSGVETTSETIVNGQAGTGNVSPVPKVGDTVTAVANAIRAQIELINVQHLDYPHAVDDMSYSTNQQNG